MRLRDKLLSRFESGGFYHRQGLCVKSSVRPDFDGVTVYVAAPDRRCTARRRVVQAPASPCDCTAWPDIQAAVRRARGRLAAGTLRPTRALSYATRWSGFVSAWEQSARG